MTQQAIEGQPSDDPGAPGPATASGRSLADDGTRQPAAAPAPGDGGTARTVPLATYTQVSQRSAAVAKRLGISKDASPDEFVAALDDLIARSSAAANDDDEPDPAIVARMRALDEREWAVARREFGDVVADAAQEFVDAIRTKGSPYAIAQAFSTAVMDAAAQMAGGDAPPTAGDARQTAAAGSEVPDLGTLPRGGGASGEIDPSAHRGDTAGFLRDLYGRVGIPARR